MNNYDNNGITTTRQSHGDNSVEMNPLAYSYITVANAGADEVNGRYDFKALSKGKAWYVKDYESDYKKRTFFSLYQCPVEQDGVDYPTWFISEHQKSKEPGTDSDNDYYSSRIIPRADINLEYPSNHLKWEVADCDFGEEPVPVIRCHQLDPGTHTDVSIDSSLWDEDINDSITNTNQHHHGDVNDHSLDVTPSSSYPSSPIRNRSNRLSRSSTPRSLSPSSIDGADGDVDDYEAFRELSGHDMDSDEDSNHALDGLQ